MPRHPANRPRHAFIHSHLPTHPSSKWTANFQRTASKKTTQTKPCLKLRCQRPIQLALMPTCPPATTATQPQAPNFGEGSGCCFQGTTLRACMGLTPTCQTPTSAPIVVCPCGTKGYGTRPSLPYGLISTCPPQHPSNTKHRRTFKLRCPTLTSVELAPTCPPPTKRLLSFPMWDLGPPPPPPTTTVCTCTVPDAVDPLHLWRVERRSLSARRPQQSHSQKTRGLSLNVRGGGVRRSNSCSAALQASGSMWTS